MEVRVLGPPDVVGDDGSVLLLIQWSPAKVKDRCREAVQLGTIEVPQILPHENHVPITLCRGLQKPLKEIWPELKLIL